MFKIVGSFNKMGDINPVDYTHESSRLYPPIWQTISTNPADYIHQSAGWHAPICWVVSTSPLDGIHQSAGWHPPVYWPVSTNLVDYIRQSGGLYPRITRVWEAGVVGVGGESCLPENSFICFKESLYSFFLFCLNLNPNLFNKTQMKLHGFTAVVSFISSAESAEALACGEPTLRINQRLLRR